MFALHSTLTTEELAADKKASAAALRRGLNPFPSRSVSIVQAAQIKYFEEHYTYPAVPGSELCMKYPAIVVAEWGIDFEGDENVSMGSLRKLGTLSLMVTDVGSSFDAEFEEATGGRTIAELRVVGFQEDGLLFLGSAPKTTHTQLPVVTDGMRRFVIAKSETGEWLLPEATNESRLVLAAVAAPAPHLDAIDGASYLIEQAGASCSVAVEAMAPAAEAGLTAAAAAGGAVVDATKPLIDKSIAVTRPHVEAVIGATKPTLESMGKGLEEASKRAAPVLEATVDRMGEGLEQAGTATRENLGKTLSKAGEVTKPVWESTVAHVSKGLEESGVAAAWDKVANGTKDAVVAPVGKLLEQSVDGTRSLLEGVGGAVSGWLDGLGGGGPSPPPPPDNYPHDLSDAEVEEAAPGPLPAGWRSERAADGRWYYFHTNDTNGTATWNRPTAATAVPPSAADVVE